MKAKAAAEAATVAGAKRSRQQLAEDDGDDGDTGMACQRGICVVYCFDDVIPLKIAFLLLLVAKATRILTHCCISGDVTNHPTLMLLEWIC